MTKRRRRATPSFLYVYSVVLEGQTLHLLWRDGDGHGVDEVLVQEDGTIPLFETEAHARQEAPQSEQFRYVAKSGPLDLDALRVWLGSSDLKPVDANYLLDAWNLFADVEAIRSDPAFQHKDNAGDEVYEKLFYGCNLPAVTPEGQRYDPTWSAEELQTIRAILVVGLDLFLSRVRRWPLP